MDSTRHPQIDPTVWEEVNLAGKKRYRCQLCDNLPPQERRRIADHEKSLGHRSNVSSAQFNRNLPAPELEPEDEDFAQELLRSSVEVLADSLVHPYESDPVDSRVHSPPAPLPPQLGVRYHLEEADFEREPTHDEMQLSHLQEVLALMHDVVLGGEGFDEGDRSDAGVEEDDQEQSTDEDDEVDIHTSKRRRLNDLLAPDDEWQPWPDKTTCALDILMHLPRSVFSQRQLDLILWALKLHNISGCPSVKQMTRFCNDIQKIYGVETIKYDGPLGHRYYVNNLAQMLSQEMSNPYVRPNLHFYPEDSRPYLAEARQGQRWLHDLPPEQTSPSMLHKKKMYYTFEPALLTGNRILIPVRWFTRKKHMYAQCWRLVRVWSNHRTFWRVIKSHGLEIDSNELLKPFPELDADMRTNPHRYDHAPPVSTIQDILDPTTGKIDPWAYKDGNPWRARARGPLRPDGTPIYPLPPHGARVLAFPLWLYCDDTSGNLTKKWNAHNSFLFTPAGLPRAEAAKEYNVHFLCTSNSAPPLEMFHGIVQQLEIAQQEGIWAWDSLTQEPVMIFPVILALLGDNPMHSEFACHVGLRGRLFCRTCRVWRGGFMRGAGEADQDEDSNSHEDIDLDNAETPSEVDADMQTAPRKTLGERTLTHIRRRLAAFIKPGVPRNRIETREHLHQFFDDATRLRTQTKIRKAKTMTGVKDTFQNFFLDGIFASYKKATDKKAALEAKLATLPRDSTGAYDIDGMINPVWRIPGLDAHQDTPVEILHVVLLGFVKYFWRDVIKNQLNDSPEKKTELAIRLSALDVSGLGISTLPGKTLTQYAGSLVGRDFRALAQVAPFAIQGMVTDECFEAWKALSTLVPTIWQPEIQNIDTYLPTLEADIHQFLLRTARWSSRWFNKPKFHIIVHLPEHIRRFGPAMLFATEAFESFNAVIRAKSIHSNRAAPSKDIAHAFAQGNRVRHIVAGGALLKVTPECVSDAPGTQRELRRGAFSPNKSDWTTVGAGPRAITEAPAAVVSYLGLPKPMKTHFCQREKEQKQPRPYRELLMGKQLPGLKSPEELFYNCQLFTLEGGDRCRPGTFVLLRSASQSIPTVARVAEVAQQPNNTGPNPDAVLVQHCSLDYTPNVYGMPYILPTNTWTLERYKNLWCTVNTQHACAELKCGIGGTRQILQERALSNMTERVVRHNPPNHRRVLNVAQMRDAATIQPLRSAREVLEEDRVIEYAAQAARTAELRKERLEQELTYLVGDAEEPAPPVDRRLGALQQRAPSSRRRSSPAQSPASTSRSLPAASGSGSSLQWTTPLTPELPTSLLPFTSQSIQWTEPLTSTNPSTSHLNTP